MKSAASARAVMAGSGVGEGVGDPDGDGEPDGDGPAEAAGDADGAVVEGDGDWAKTSEGMMHSDKRMVFFILEVPLW
ncbi:MAG: hypothetical protein RIQ81_1810 [Pseudomonadota bacterium]|jgi:hypothetical protein